MAEAGGRIPKSFHTAIAYLDHIHRMHHNTPRCAHHELNLLKPLDPLYLIKLGKSESASAASCHGKTTLLSEDIMSDQSSLYLQSNSDVLSGSKANGQDAL
jgi:hypothetical protein